MATSNLDKLRVELYGNNGQFMGYLKSVSVSQGKLVSVNDKFSAKTYAKQETAIKDIGLIDMISRGTLIGRID